MEILHQKLLQVFASLDDPLLGGTNFTESFLSKATTAFTTDIH
jgi:hypothetical protein